MDEELKDLLKNVIGFCIDVERECEDSDKDSLAEEAHQIRSRIKEELERRGIKF